MQVCKLLCRYFNILFSDTKLQVYLRTETCMFTVFDNGSTVSIPAQIPTKSRPAINIS